MIFILLKPSSPRLAGPRYYHVYDDVSRTPSSDGVVKRYVYTAASVSHTCNFVTVVDMSISQEDGASDDQHRV